MTTRSDHLNCATLGGVPPAPSARVRQALPLLAGLVLFVAALDVLRVELRTVSWSDLTAAVIGVPHGQLALAIALTVLSYAVLTGTTSSGLPTSARRCHARESC